MTRRRWAAVCVLSGAGWIGALGWIVLGFGHVPAWVFLAGMACGALFGVSAVKAQRE